MLNRLLKFEVHLNNEKNFAYKFIHFFLDRLNFSIPYRMYGLNFILPIIYGMGFYNLLRTESWLINVIEKLNDIKEGAFLDVGANLGQTLIRFKSLKLSQKYFGFEPNNGSYLYISELIRKNNFENCEVFPIALSDENRVTNFYKRHRADVSSTLIEGYKVFTNQSNRMNVACFRGDDIIDNIGIEEIGIIKIDVEGGESEIIHGFRNTIGKGSPFIICEILPVYHLNSENLRNRKKRQDLLIKELSVLGYSVFRIKNNLSLEFIERIEVHSNLMDSNYLFVPNHMVNKVESMFEIFN